MDNQSTRPASNTRAKIFINIARIILWVYFALMLVFTITLFFSPTIELPGFVFCLFMCFIIIVLSVLLYFKPLFGIVSGTGFYLFMNISTLLYIRQEVAGNIVGILAIIGFVFLFIGFIYAYKQHRANRVN
jgi:hypothetical protein